MKLVVMGGTGLIGSRLVNKLVRRLLETIDDSREVTTDRQACFFGIASK